MSDTGNNSQANPKLNECIKSTITSTSTILKKTKSRTVIKKTKIKNNNSFSSTAITKKRKLDEHHTDPIPDSIEPHSKRRKIDNNNINKKVNNLIELNESFKQKIHELQQQNNSLTKQRDHYQEDANKWKTQYMELYNQLNDSINLNSNTNNSKTVISNNANMKHNQFDVNIISNKKNTLTVSPTPPPSKYFHKPKQKRVKETLNNDIDIKPVQINNIELDVDENDNSFTNQPLDLISQSNNMIFNNMSNGLTNKEDTNVGQINDDSNENKNNYRKRLRSHSKKKQSDEDNDNDLDFVEYEDSYYVSVNCHFCGQHFDAIYDWRDHLKAHFDDDQNKVWGQCDFGCKALRPMQDTHFIRHISMHTGDRPYQCNIIVNGKQCTVSKGYKSEMKPHWRSHSKTNMKTYVKKSKPIITINKEKINTNNNDELRKIDKHKNHRFKGAKRIKKGRNIHVGAQYVDFGNSYHFSVNCHVCNTHFDDCDNYMIHLQDHYDDSSNNKIWRKCDFSGCKTKQLLKDGVTFLEHISTHTSLGNKPFKCDVIVKGTKCEASFGSRRYIQNHWYKHFKNRKSKKHQKKPKKKRIVMFKKQTKRKRIVMFKKSTKALTDVDFEDSYYVSINCHLCNTHFDKIDEYKWHLKAHYDNDKDKEWFNCDLGCNYTATETFSWICHLSSHTKSYAYHCNVTVRGVKCTSEAGTKSNMKNHYNNIHNKNNYNNVSNDEYSNSVSDDDSYESSSSDSSNCSSSYSISTSNDESNTGTESEIEPDLLKELEIDSDNNTESDTDNDDEETDLFYKAHLFSMQCHFCETHFNGYTKYKNHIEKHYIEQADKEWLVCDFGCYTSKNKNSLKLPNKSANPGNFIAHLCSHLEVKPFKCSYVVNGSKCTKSLTTRGGMKIHWKNVHCKTKPKNVARKEFVETRLRARKMKKLRADQPVILCSNLTSEQMEYYRKFKVKFNNAALFVFEWQNNVTHLITNATIQNQRILSARTIKYFQAIVSGAWVLCFDWLQKCLSQQRLINEIDYEVLGDSQAKGACKISRDLKQKNQNAKRLFSSIICIISSEFKINKLDDDLRHIFRIGDATVCNELPYEWLNNMDKYKTDTNGKTVIFVYDKEKTKMTSRQLDFVQKFGIETIGYHNVFDAISNYKPITNFISDEK